MTARNEMNRRVEKGPEQFTTKARESNSERRLKFVGLVLISEKDSVL
jgi:hypothetical protein